jgi:hypothetical protein
LIDLYLKNIDTLLTLEPKDHYENEQAVVIACYKKRDIQITEFLFAKYGGYINDKKFNNQLNKRFRCISNPQERAAISSILSPARPFWRHAGMIEELYTYFLKMEINK